MNLMILKLSFINYFGCDL